MFALLGSMLLIMVGLTIVSTIVGSYEKRRVCDQISDLASEVLELSPEELIPSHLGVTVESDNRNPKEMNVAGIYILCNQTKDRCYVGQGRQVLDRIPHHFEGTGNSEVYEDYTRGDEFIVKLIPLKDSGYQSLNELERHTIMTYNACDAGYNSVEGKFR